MSGSTKIPDPEPGARRVGDRVRRLALAKVRELRALGWSYREIGRCFAVGSQAASAADRPAMVAAPAPADGSAATSSGGAVDHRAFLHALDLVGDGLAFFDRDGVLLHANRAFVRLLQRSAAGDELGREAFALAHSLGCAFANRLQRSDATVSAEAPEGRGVRTATGTYRLRGSPLVVDPFGVGGTVLIALEPPRAPVPSNEVLRERFRLSPQECRVARLLAEGRSNAEVAVELGISPHTVRRHTERLFVKLDVHSRAEVGQRLQAEAGREERHR